MKFLKDKKFFLVIIMASTMFFMFGFIVMKLVLPKPKKPEIKINVEQSKNPPPPPPQLPITHEQQFNNTQQKQQETNSGPGTPSVTNPGGVEKEKIKEISKHDIDKKEHMEKKEHRDVFRDFYLTKQRDNKNDKNSKDNKNKQQKIEQQNIQQDIPPLPPPISINSNSTNMNVSPVQQVHSYKDVKIYGFYVRDNEIFVITNIGILSRNSKIDNNEIVLDITKNKIITNMREIFF